MKKVINICLIIALFSLSKSVAAIDTNRYFEFGLVRFIPNRSVANPGILQAEFRKCNYYMNNLGFCKENSLTRYNTINNRLSAQNNLPLPPAHKNQADLKQQPPQPKPQPKPQPEPLPKPNPKPFPHPHPKPQSLPIPPKPKPQVIIQSAGTQDNMG